MFSVVQWYSVVDRGFSLVLLLAFVQPPAITSIAFVTFGNYERMALALCRLKARAHNDRCYYIIYAA